MSTDVTATRTRAEKTKRFFLDESGEASPRAGLTSTAGRIVFVETGDTLEFAYEELTPEIRRAAALFGIMTSVTNTVGRADMTVDEMVDAATARLEAIVQDGRWSAERQSGPRTGDLVEAAARWYAERNKEFSAETRAAISQKLADENEGDAYRKKLLANESFAAHFAAIKAERAAERASKAKAKLSGASTADEPESLL